MNLFAHAMLKAGVVTPEDVARVVDEVEKAEREKGLCERLTREILIRVPEEGRRDVAFALRGKDSSFLELELTRLRGEGQ